MNREPELEVLISKRKIAAAVRRLAAQVRQDYIQKDPLLVGILKGSFMFMADLVRALEIPLEIDFVRLASYGSGTRSSGRINFIQDLTSPVRERHVIIVEDIVDSGLSTAFLRDYLKEKGPASLKLCALLDKPSRRRISVQIDYLGFQLPDEFIVGYGTDLNEKYRNLKDICVLKESL